MGGLPARAALAVVVVALLATGCGGDDDADRPAATPTSATPSGPSTEPSSTPALPAHFLPTARDLPTRTRLTAWQQVEPSDGLPGGKDVAAEVRITILQYATEADGETAEAAVTGWIRKCDAPTGFERAGATRQGDLVATEAGTYATWAYAAPEVCTECDATWFERMGVLADLGRMVVVSFREIGGPLEPEGLDATMRDLMLHAAGRSMPG